MTRRSGDAKGNESRRTNSKHISPSRLRYQASHPVVSFRVTLKELQKLRELQRTTGLPLARIVNRILGLEVRTTEEAYQKGFNDGFGQLDAPCVECGNAMRVDLKNERDAEAKKVLLQARINWGHAEFL